MSQYDRRRPSITAYTGQRRRLQDLIEAQALLHDDLVRVHADLAQHKLSCDEIIQAFRSYKAALSFMTKCAVFSTTMLKFAIAIATVVGILWGVVWSTFRFFGLFKP